MLIGLVVTIGIVGLAVALTTKDSTLIKNLLFCWLAAALFLVLVLTGLFRGEFLIPRSRMTLPLGVYLCLAAVSTLLSRYKYASVQELLSMACCAMVLVVAARGVTSKKALMVVLGALAVVAFVGCMYAIAQHYGFDPLYGEDASLPSSERSLSTMGHPNFFGSFLVLALPVLLSVFFASQRPFVKASLVILICGAELSLLYTQSRGAWLGLLGALPAWFLLSVPEKRLRLILAAPTVAIAAGMFALLTTEEARGYVILWALPFWVAAAIVLRVLSRQRRVCFTSNSAWAVSLLATVIFASNGLVNRDEIRGRMKAAFEVEKGSVRARKVIWAGTLNMVKARPIFGWGLGTFSIYFPRFRDPATAVKIMPNTLHAHSEYLEIAAEMGVIGLAAFLWIIGAFFWESLRRTSRAGNELHRLALAGLAAGCGAILLQAVVCVTTRWVVGRFFLWLGLGLAMAVGGMSGLAGTEKSKTRRGEVIANERGRFYRIKVKPIRKPILRAIVVLAVGGLLFAAGWWEKRIWDSAVLTRRGEGYQTAAENVLLRGLSAEKLVAALDRKRAFLDEAARHYDDAVRRNRYNLSAYYKLAHCYNLQGKLEDSLRAYLRMAELAPDGSDIHFNVATVYANMRRWEDSREEYETALRMKIGPLTRLGLARAYENLHLLEKAKEQYEATRKDFPDYRVQALNGVAAMDLRRDAPAAAMERYKEAIESDPEDADARLGMGLAYQMMGNFHKRRGEDSQAIEYYQKSIAEQEIAVRNRPESVPSRAALALVYAEVRRFEDALGQLRAASNIRPNDPLLSLNLGKVYRRMNEPERAVEAFRRTMELDSHGPFGVEASTQLKMMGIER